MDEPGFGYGKGQRLLWPAVLCAVLATLALIVSWTADGGLRLAGGIGSAVFSVTAAFLAASWYRRRLDDPPVDAGDMRRRDG